MTPLSPERIASALAGVTATRLCRRCVLRLQQMSNTLSADDSGLRTTWDEICVQAQSERSKFWDAYESAMHDALAWDVSQLPIHERAALWLETPRGQDWQSRDDDSSLHEDFVCEDEIIRYLVKDHVLSMAATWSNARIRTFLDHADMRD
jgi:hypothetical protein